MSDSVIQVENLSKKYVLRHQGVDRGLRHALQNAVSAPLRLFRKKSSPSIETKPSSNEEFWALKNVSFEIKPGEVVGIIGRNGAGKSTLLKVLSRITEPTDGRVIINGRTASLLEVGTGFHPELTGRENIYLNGAILGMSRLEIKKKFDEIVAFAEVEKFLDTPVKHYSSGMYVRLAFSVAAHLEPEILIVDEVLAVGDAQFQKKCLGKMQDVSTKEGRTVLFVSHNMGAILNLCRRGIVMEKGRCVSNLPILEAVEFYNHSIAREGTSGNSKKPHVLYEETEAKSKELRVTKIELLDEARTPKAVFGTWDNVVFRIWYESDRRIPHAAAEININSMNGGRLFVLSTQPDSTVAMDILPGIHFVDCLIERFPLSAGDYLLCVGFTIPYVSYLWWKNDLATFTVYPRDVYESGLAPQSGRSLVAPVHKWTLSP